MVSQNQPSFLGAVICVLLVTACQAVATAGYELVPWTPVSGGGASSGGNHGLTGSMGQPMAGNLAGGPYSLVGGFWPAAPAEVSFVDQAGELPVNPLLGSPFPNPFNPVTNIHFALAEPGMASLLIFDPRGRLVRRLVQGEMPAGRHLAVWDGTNDQGGHCSSGIFFVRFEAADVVSTRKVTLLK